MADSHAITNGHAVLSVRGLSKFYGSNQVLADFDLDVKPGEVVALLGENGAGKSTASAIINGVIQPDAGTMRWLGKPYAPASPREAIATGVGLIHQEIQLLPELSIAENVFVGRLPMRNGRIDRKLINKLAAEQLARLGLDISPEQKVGTLKVAAQQQIEIAKALSMHSRLLILDEPTAALGSDETQRLFEQIDSLRAEGVSFIYISHRLDEIPVIADRVVVLRDGKLVASHSDATVPIQTLVQDMVGRDITRIFPKAGEPSSKVVLEVAGLTSAEGSFAGINFAVHAGEIFGIAGIVGAGRTELVRAIMGADPLATGTITVNGKQLKLDGTRSAIEAGVVLVPEDRKQQGLILQHTLADNVAVGNMDIVAASGWTRPAQMDAFASDAIDNVGVKGTPDQQMRELSGGNQQKLVIAKWLTRKPQVFILDEPTRGIDVGARAAIYDMVAELARNGTAILLVSSDLDEVIGLSHRVMVLSRGRQRDILAGGTDSHEAVINLATT